MAGFEIHLFGATTLVGQYFLSNSRFDSEHFDLISYSRQNKKLPGKSFFADFDDPSSYFSPGNSVSPKIWVVFAPIWKFSSFFARLASQHPERLIGLSGVIACSSSSVISKRFSFNCSDRDLVSRLLISENQLIDACRLLEIPCCILRPTLIYGQFENYADSNLRRILQLLRVLPILPLPAQTGLRQPIHASQLSNVTMHFVDQLVSSNVDSLMPQRIAVGGDTTLTYTQMISSLQMAQPSGDLSRRCFLLPIPNRLFFLFAALLLIRSPKYYEAVLRIGANLSGFTPAHQLLGAVAQPFPVLTLGSK